MRIIIYLISLMLIFIISSCSNDRTIILDSRYQVTRATEWSPQYIPNKNGSGIIFNFTRNKNVLDDSLNSYFTLYAYPLDTLKVVENYQHIQQTLPTGGFANEIHIDYKIKNKPIEFSKIIDSKNHVRQELPSNTYYLRINCNWFSVTPRYIKGIKVKKGYWSIININVFKYLMRVY